VPLSGGVGSGGNNPPPPPPPPPGVDPPPPPPPVPPKTSNPCANPQHLGPIWAFVLREYYGFAPWQGWRARSVTNFEPQNATVQRFRPFAQTAQVHPATCSTTIAACTAALQPVAQPLQPSPLQLAALQPATLQPCSQQLCSLHSCRLQMQKGSAAIAEGLQILSRQGNAYRVY
jgi:hypothetical protein